MSVLQLFIGRVSWRTGSAASEVLDAYLARGPEPDRAVMPEAVAVLLAQCFAQDPAERPAGMGVVAEQLVSAYEARLGRPYPRLTAKAAGHRADGLNNKALSWLDMGELEQAERCWEQALQAEPRHPDGTYNWGLMRWRAAQITDQQLVDDLEVVRAAQVAAGVADGCTEYLLGSVHLERGDITAAGEMLGKAARLAPADPEITTALKTATTLQQTQTHQPVILSGRASMVRSLAVTPDGRHALSGGADGTVRW